MNLIVHKNNQNMKAVLIILSFYDMPLLKDCFFALCPAEVTTSSGRGANEDQYSCLAVAISGYIPANLGGE